MGEWSKKLGEHGEDVVAAFMYMIGWKAPLTGIDLDCYRGHEHSQGNSPRRSHGVDFLFPCVSPLEDEVLKHLLVSSKYSSNAYPASPANKFKDYFLDLAMALECYRRSAQKKLINSGYQGISAEQIAGVLFWINDEDPSDMDVVRKIAASKGIDDLNYNTIYVVDNYRASFLYESITYTRSRYGSENVRFLYPSTGRNISPSTRMTSGTVLPPEYLNSGIVPFVVQQNGVKSLTICCQDNFSSEALSRLVGFSISIGSEFPGKIEISFADYSFAKHEQDVGMVKAMISNKEVAQTVEVTRYSQDFRSISQ